MYKYSTPSASRILTVSDNLHRLFYTVLKRFDHTVLEGHRSNERQDEMFRQGLSKLKGGQSLHNHNPSLAIDVAPYPIDWKNIKRFYYFAGLVKATAIELEIDIIWGGDWDNDNDFDDQTFMDLVHFQERIKS